jgi:PAS domain S-box-containing protein
MQLFPPTPQKHGDRAIQAIARLMRLTLYLLPLLPVLYLTLWQDPALRFDDALFHEAAIALATLEGTALTYVCWLCYQRSGELLVKRMTQGFMAFTVVYSLHGMFTPVAAHHMALFILYGPASRLCMGLLLLYAVRAHNQVSESVSQRGKLAFWWRFLGFLMLVNVLVAALANSQLGTLPWPRMGMEIGALLTNVASLIWLGFTRARTPLMRHYMLALAWFAVASLAFLLAEPWNHLWWLAHGIFAVGFSILGYGVLRAYLTTHALERVFSSEELFDDLAKVNARLVEVLQEYEATNSTLKVKLLELERSRHSFSSLLAAVPDAILIVETGGRILEANSAAEQLFGFSARSLLGLSVDLLTPLDLRETHAKRRQQFEFAPHTRAMGGNNAPLRCLHRHGHVFLAHISIGSLMFEGQRCVVTLLRPVPQQQDDYVRQRALDRQQIERGRMLGAVLTIADSMLFALQRSGGGSYLCAVRSDACALGLHIARDATPADWIQQWFNRIVPGDLPRIISAIETAALTHQALHLQWSHHVPGRGTEALQLVSGAPEDTTDGSQVWVCRVMPRQEIPFIRNPQEKHEPTI